MDWQSVSVLLKPREELSGQRHENGVPSSAFPFLFTDRQLGWRRRQIASILEDDFRSGSSGSGERKSIQVLVIDDEQSLLRMVRMTLVVEGFDVVIAEDGFAGLDAVRQNDPDVIVLDLQMPRMDGRTFYRELRSAGFTIPVIILSAFGASDASRELGAQGALEKPFNPVRLISMIESLTSSST